MQGLRPSLIIAIASHSSSVNFEHHHLAVRSPAFTSLCQFVAFTARAAAIVPTFRYTFNFANLAVISQKVVAIV